MKSPSLCAGALWLGQLCGALVSHAGDWRRVDAVASDFESVLARTICAVNGKSTF